MCTIILILFIAYRYQQIPNIVTYGLHLSVRYTVLSIIICIVIVDTPYFPPGLATYLVLGLASLANYRANLRRYTLHDSCLE